MQKHQRNIDYKGILGFLILVLSQSSFAEQQMNVDKNGVMLHGYDPVAYFIQGKPMLGFSAFQARYHNGLFYFISAENQATFLEDPDHYAPAYGGYCSYGVRMGKKFDIDPHSWMIIDGKLYLQLNKATQLVWQKDIRSNISIGNKIWPEIRNVSVSKLLE